MPSLQPEIVEAPWVVSASNQRVNDIEAVLRSMPQVECPLVHLFTPGLYSRQIFMPAGSLILSKIHKTRHPYNISKGRVSVWTEGEGVVHLQAPYSGVTEPGTRRILYIHEDTIWTTYHATDKCTPEEVEHDIIFKHEVEPALPSSEDLTHFLSEAQKQ